MNRDRVAALVLELATELGIELPRPKRKRIVSGPAPRVVPTELQRHKAKKILKEILPR